MGSDRLLRRSVPVVRLDFLVVLLAAGMLQRPGSIAAAVIQVPGDQPTIQQGINAASPGDEVLVSPGTYPESAINFLGKALWVHSSGGSAVTIIDAGGAGSVVRFVSGETPSAILEGFTLRNGSGLNGEAGGIHILASSPTVRGNIVRNNISGGILVANGSALIENNIVESNTFEAGITIGGVGTATIRSNTVRNNINAVGIESSFASPLIEGNVVVGNNGGSFGGGIRLIGASAPMVRNNLIENNIASNGAGMEMFAAGPPTLLGNIFRGNGGLNGTPAGQGGGIWIVNHSDALIVQNLFHGNRANEGGGIYWLVPSGSRGPILLNNTIALNFGATGSGLLADGYDRDALIQNNIIVADLGQTAVYCGGFNDLFLPTFRHNNVYSALGPEYGGIAPDLTGTNGNISADPEFLNPPTDFHLFLSSPCIDAGLVHPDLPPTDPDGDPRMIDGDGDDSAIVDIGWDEFTTRPTATMVSVVSAESDRERITVVWELGLDPGDFATIYRQAPDERWTPQQHALPDFDGRVTFDDHDVQVGARYGYRIGVRGGARETYHGEVWVVMPATATLTLAGFAPNPAPAGRGVVSLTLAGSEPAVLEVFDVGGRRVANLPVSGPGAHAIPFHELGQLRPGVFVIRLTQGSRTEVVRGIVVE